MPTRSETKDKARLLLAEAGLPGTSVSINHENMVEVTIYAGALLEAMELQLYSVSTCTDGEPVKLTYYTGDITDYIHGGEW